MFFPMILIYAKNYIMKFFVKDSKLFLMIELEKQ